MAAVTDPVPGPSSTTTGSPLRGTTAASRAASVGELGATAPTVAGLRSTAATKAARCGGKSGMAPSLPAATPYCEVDLRQVAVLARPLSRTDLSKSTLITVVLSRLRHPHAEPCGSAFFCSLHSSPPKHFPESLDLLLTALTNSRVGASGPHFQFPSRRHRSPTAHPTAPRRRPSRHDNRYRGAAAQRGLPLLLGMHASDAEKSALIGHYDQVAGRPSPVGHIAAALAYIADNRRDATAAMRTCLPPE